MGNSCNKMAHTLDLFSFPIVLASGGTSSPRIAKLNFKAKSYFRKLCDIKNTTT